MRLLSYRQFCFTPPQKTSIIEMMPIRLSGIAKKLSFFGFKRFFDNLRTIQTCAASAQGRPDDVAAKE
jgi:hypothetical protein